MSPARPDLTPPPGWPTVEPFVRPAWSRPRTPDGVLVPGPAPDAIMDGPDGQPVALYRHPPHTTPALPVVPETPARTGMDPVTLRILASGAAAPLFGWGASMLFGAMAGAQTALGYLAACLALAWLLRSGSGRQGAVNVRVNVNNSTTVRGKG